MTLTAEFDEVHEALALLREIHARLATKHGVDFRRLDRAIEDFIENPADCVEAHWLGGGKILAVPKGEFTVIFREARRLGLIH